MVKFQEDVCVFGFSPLFFLSFIRSSHLILILLLLTYLLHNIMHYYYIYITGGLHIIDVSW